MIDASFNSRASRSEAVSGNMAVHKGIQLSAGTGYGMEIAAGGAAGGSGVVIIRNAR